MERAGVSFPAGARAGPPPGGRTSPPLPAPARRLPRVRSRSAEAQNRPWGGEGACPDGRRGAGNSEEDAGPASGTEDRTRTSDRPWMRSNLGGSQGEEPGSESVTGVFKLKEDRHKNRILLGQ